MVEDKIQWDKIELELGRERDIWLQLLIQRRHYFSDLFRRGVESQLSHLSTLAAISLGALSFIVDKVGISWSISWAFLFFLISLVSSTVLLLVGFEIDQRNTKRAEDEEIGMYQEYYNSIISLINKALSKELSQEDVIVHKNLKNTEEKSLPKISPWPKRIVQFLYYSSTTTFMLAVSLLTFFFIFS